MLVATATAVVAFAGGMRWFAVETASMGSAAPVGTLVLTEPARLDALPVGTVIAFHPPTAAAEVYTHRIDGREAGGVRTRGDINGAADAWRLHQRDLIGRAVVLLPGAGFLIRALPVLLVGNAVLWLLTSRVRAAAPRAALRTVGFSLIACVPAFLLHPFVKIEVLATQAVGDRIHASIVSTGLLPIRVTAATGQQVALHDGQVGVLTLPVRPEGYRLMTDVQLTASEWAVLLLVCALPLIWNLVVGTPEDRVRRRHRA